MRRVQQIKVKSAYGNMYCVSMYIGGIMVDCVNGITEAQKDDYIQLFERKLLTVH